MQPAIPAIEPEDYRQQVVMKWLLLTVLGVAVFLNSLMGAFVFDDQRLVIDNPDIRSLGLSSKAWSSPHRTTLWTLAVNRAVGQDKPWGYHLVNVVLHALSGLVLFGLLCRTLLRQSDRPRLQELAPWIAFSVALLWMIHPLQTQSVTYVSSRSDLVAGLCFLLTLYGTLRGAEEQSSVGWYGLAILACALGMGEAPYMAVAPVVVLLYDRIYPAESFAESLKRRRGLYAGLAACWLLLALPLLGDAGVASRDPLTYLLTQFGVILHYLRLTLWPHDLCFDYSDWPETRKSGDALVPGVVVFGLLASAAFVSVWWPKIGFPAVWFFLTLLPSSIVPQPEFVREQRMYLPLVGLSALVVLAAVTLTRPLDGRVAVPEAVGLLVALPVAAILGFVTFQRNEKYYNAVDLWQDTVAKRPANVLARQQLGKARLSLAGALFNAGKFDQAATEYRAILDSDGVPEEMREAAHRNLGLALGMSGDLDAAVSTLESNWGTDSERGAALNLLGLKLLLDKKDHSSAERCFRDAIRLQPDIAAYHSNLAEALKLGGKVKEAEAEKQSVLNIDPDFFKPKR